MAYFIFLKSLESLEDFQKNPHVKIPPKSPCTFFQSSTKFKKNQLKFEKNFFLNFGPSPVFGPVVAHLPSPQRQPTYQPIQWPSAGPHGLPFFSLADVQALPSSPSLSQVGRAPKVQKEADPSPTPWREADPQRPLPLPLLYCPPPPPPLPVTDGHRHQWRRLHFTVSRSPPSPSTTIKALWSCLTSLHPTPPSFPPL
jgi:hypothetical protein